MADDGTIMRLTSGNLVLVKVLRHFPLILRLKRLYMSSKTTPLMRWHDEGCIKDGKLRHPADSYAQKKVDDQYSNLLVTHEISGFAWQPMGLIHLELWVLNTAYGLWL